MDISKDDKSKDIYSIPNRIAGDSGEYYEILENRLGSGGNAVVYEVLDVLGESYAVKFLLNDYPVNKKRFKQEIRVLREISHPHLIRRIDEGSVEASIGGKTCRLLFLVMEKADRNLKSFLIERGKLDYSEYISQFCGLSEALARLNTKVVHRDIKLENILIVGERWVLSDLGICSYISEEEHEDLTKIGEKIGPKYWMSPEAINAIYRRDVEIVPASDVFQLSAVFWFVVNGVYPLGIVTDKDWNNTDTKTCELLLAGLSFAADNRPQNGEELYKKFCDIRGFYEKNESIGVN